MTRTLPRYSLPVLLLLAGCVLKSEPKPQPAPAPTPSNFDRSFDAAVAAAADVGVQVQSADRAGGQIKGTKAGADVTIDLLRQANGTVKVAFKAQGSTETNPTLGERWTSSYHRRMGN